jgi:antirestriction protein ArdC
MPIRVRAGEDRANLYDEITDKIIAELEARPRALGPALGHGRDKGAAGNAEERVDRPLLFRH